MTERALCITVASLRGLAVPIDGGPLVLGDAISEAVSMPDLDLCIEAALFSCLAVPLDGDRAVLGDAVFRICTNRP